MKLSQQQGMTLIDLMLTISLVAILLGEALPAFNHTLNKSKVDAASMMLKSSLQLARKTAITQNKKVTICPIENGSIQATPVCSKNWSDGYMVFIDDNEDRQLSANESLVYKNLNIDDKIQLRWKAFGVRSSMQWHHTGITNHQNGTFEFCYNQQPKYSRALIITKAGRIRASKDLDGDGIHENSRGKNLSC